MVVPFDRESVSNSIRQYRRRAADSQNEYSYQFGLLSAQPVDTKGTPKLAPGVNKPALVLGGQREQLERVEPISSPFSKLRASGNNFARVVERRDFAPVLQSHSRARKADRPVHGWKPRFRSLGFNHLTGRQAVTFRSQFIGFYTACSIPSLCRPFCPQMQSSPMPLTAVHRPGIETPTGIHFGMTHERTSIRVVVTQEVLQSIADGSVDKASLLAKFNLYRRQFEAIASNKFDRGEKGPIKLTRADVIKFAAEKKPSNEPAI